MGEEAEDVLTSTNIITVENKNYETVLGKFNEYFKVCDIFERARLNPTETNSKGNQQNST